MHDLIEIFRFLSERGARGEGVALVTVTAVTGASSRNPGTHMAVAQDGSFVGSLSGGCIEAAVVADAQNAIADGLTRSVRFGAGSPYIDIRLPCGGGIDLLFTPLTDPAFARTVYDTLVARTAITLMLPLSGGTPQTRMGHTIRTAQTGGTDFIVNHVPPLRMIILGNGGAVEALHEIASAMDIETRVLTPQAQTLERLTARGVRAARLSRDPFTPDFTADPWTAWVFLFHDHDWETALLGHALEQPSFYIGAMGSLSTARARRARLSDLGIADDKLARIRAPIGLIRSSRDPQTLALSVLVEVVDAYNRFAEANVPART